jgi:hypothetical protein
MAGGDDEIDRERIALGVQQPWAELIVRGIKTLEVRSQPTSQRGPIYIYSSRRLSQLPAALEAARRHRIDVDGLPLGLLVGSVEITGCRPCRPSDHRAACVPSSLLADCYAWELAAAMAFAEPVPVRFLPYGVWFYPFKRRNPPKRRRAQ